MVYKSLNKNQGGREREKITKVNIGDPIFTKIPLLSVVSNKNY